MGGGRRASGLGLARAVEPTSTQALFRNTLNFCQMSAALLSGLSAEQWRSDPPPHANILVAARAFVTA